MAANAASDIIKQILLIVAPIVLAWLANQFMGEKEQEPEAESTDVLGDLIGGRLQRRRAAAASLGTKRCLARAWLRLVELKIRINLCEELRAL